MKLDVRFDENYPYLFASSLEEELASYEDWPDDHPEKIRALQNERERFERISYDVPDHLANELLALRKREEELVQEICQLLNITL